MVSMLILQILGAYSNDVLVFVTVGLVVLTGIYAIQTKRTVAVLEKTAKLEFLPYLKAHIHMVGPMNLKLRISNIGKSSASEVKVTFTVIGVTTVTRTWMHQLLAPNQSQDFFIPTTEKEEQSNFPYFENNPTKVHIVATYKDILGNNQTSNDQIDISEFVSQFKKTKSIYMEDKNDVFARNISTISDEMKKITRALSNLSDGVSKERKKI